MTEHDMIRSLVGEGRAVAPCQATLMVGPDIALRRLKGVAERRELGISVVWLGC